MANVNMSIEVVGIESMTEVVAGLVKQGLTFKATEGRCGVWTIELTGGY